MPDISRLLTADEMSRRLNGRMSAERLMELVSAKIVPHYDFDGTTLFAYTETLNWLRDNMLLTIVPAAVPHNIAITPVVLRDLPKESPDELRGIMCHLIPLPIQSLEYATFSGVYFLCRNRKVVYVGQSMAVSGRVGAHMKDKLFDYAYCLRVPPSDLDYVEGEMIRALKPEYNFGKYGLCSPIGSPPTATGSGIMAKFSAEDGSIK